jgi:hypothetical protein
MRKTVCVGILTLMVFVGTGLAADAASFLTVPEMAQIRGGDDLDTCSEPTYKCAQDQACQQGSMICYAYQGNLEYRCIAGDRTGCELSQNGEPCFWERRMPNPPMNPCPTTYQNCGVEIPHGAANDGCHDDAE